MSTVQGGQGNIVTNGLVLNLDAANPRSYPQPYNGTDWQNLVPVSGSISGSLANGVGYTGSNFGALTFDGVDDYIPLSNPSSSYIQAFTIQSWIAYEPTSAGYHSIVGNENYSSATGWYYGVHNLNTNQIGYRIWKTNGSYYNWNGSLHLTNGTYVMYTLTVDAQSSINAYSNTTLLQSQVADSTPLKYANASPWYALGGTKGRAASPQFYNRALNASEILQNFNATRARFGV
jgi:hypothetical protein